jgi:hypothetical protein
MQTTILLLLISWLFGNLATIGSPGMFVYGAFVLVYVYAFTELMNRNKFSVMWEFFKSSSGIGIIYYYGDWFGASNYLPWINTALVIYFATAFFITAWFVFYDFKKMHAVAETITLQNV